MIPHKLHQVWVGTKEKPTQWMKSWTDKHPDWEYILWDNKRVAEYPFRNRKHIDRLMEEGKYHGVADIVRYEAIYDMGGVAVPADSECVNPIDDLLEEPFTCYENEVHYPDRLCPIVGAEKGNKFLKEVIEGLLKKEYIGEPWIDCGNQYLTEVMANTDNKIKVLPSWVFMPNHRLGGNWNGVDKIYAYQYSGTTFSQMKYSENPAISVVIPCWGSYQQYLPQCLQSLSEQQYREFEVIVDDTPNLSKARNNGIKKAKCKYILPLDADDRLHPEYLNRVVQELREWDVVTTNHQEFGDHHSASEWREEVTLEGILQGDKPIACSAFKKEWWKKIGGYDESFIDGYEDWDFWIRMAKAGARIKRITDILYYYRKHKGGMSEDIINNVELNNKLKEKHNL